MTAQTSTQVQIIPKFSEQKKAFSIDELKWLINAAKNMRDLNQAKGYLCSYFIPAPTRMESSCGGQKSKTSSTSLIKILINLSVQLPKSFTHNLNRLATRDPQKSRIFKLGGQLYLNIFPGFLHILRPISTFESTTHLTVKFIFSHIQDIWYSGDWNLTEYIIKWLAGVAAGRKMYSILYLKSGQGWGKSIITDFIQRSVLGTQLVYKTSDPQTILGSFNGQLQGKVLLLLEEMPTEKSQWNNLYRSLKDKVTGDIMEIHEKYKTPIHYKNFISTIVLTNENALRVENDDRRTVFLDMSPSRKGDLNYFKKLSDAMKYPGASEAFYAYLKAIADAYPPDFNGNPPPMTTSKQDHIISTLPPLFQFIKDTYLIVKNHITDLPVQEFYRKPAEEKPAPVEKKPTEEKSALVVPKKTLPPVPPKPDSLKVKPAPVINEDPIPEESPAPIESDTDEIIDSFSDCYLSDEEPDQENEPPAKEPAFKADDDYDVLDDLLSDSNLTTVNPTPEQQPKSPAESSAKSESVADFKSSTEPVVELTLKEQPIPEPDTELEVDRDPEPKEDLIRAYKEDHNAEIIPTTSGYETIKMNKSKAREIPEERPKTEMEHQWKAANGFVNELDIDEACDMIDSF
ncbi:highly derived D5-like helicase-primase [Rhizophagus irregularis DAOM 181602=DAOM 197198]|nr:highly derived D5-like helicase-primase [Rhizophagus irregularis DAOM 181602=DAOM 197198]